MKKIASLLLFVFLPSIALDIEGTEIWNDDGQVRIVNSIIIQDGAHLTINEGVEIVVTDSSANSDGGPIRIESGGRLDIKGAKRNPVLINGADGLNWSGFQVYSDSVEILHTITSGASTMFYIDNGNLTLKNSFINPISTGLSCNGIYNVISKNNVFWDCEVTLTGNDSYANITNNTFYNDPSSSSLVSMRIIWETNAVISNNIFYTKQNPIVFIGNASNPIILQNLSKVNIGKDSNYVGDPLFVDPDNNDFTLQPFSPAIDAGQIDSTYSNEPGINGKRINLGAYGNTDEAAESKIEMTYPVSGEKLTVDDNVTVTWKSSKYSGDKLLELSTDNGSTWATVTTVLEDSGSYSWKVPAHKTTEAKLRLSCKRDNRVTDMTDAFEINDGTPILNSSLTMNKQGLTVRSLAGKTEFTLAQAGEASLKIYSLNGSEVASLSTGSDRKSLTWDHGSLGAQIFVYKLTAGTKEMTGSFSIR